MKMNEQKWFPCFVAHLAKRGAAEVCDEHEPGESGRHRADRSFAPALKCKQGDALLLLGQQHVGTWICACPLCLPEMPTDFEIVPTPI